MECNKIRELLSLYIDEMLDVDQMKETDAHLAVCAACKKEYEEMLELVQLLNQVESVPIPAAFELRMKKVLKEERTNNPFIPAKGSSNRSKWKILTSIAAVFVVGVISFSVYHDVLGILPDKLDGGNQSAVVQPKKIAENEVQNKAASGGALLPDSALSSRRSEESDSVQSAKILDQSGQQSASSDKQDVNNSIKKQRAKTTSSANSLALNANNSDSAGTTAADDTYGAVTNSDQLAKTDQSTGSEESAFSADSAEPKGLVGSTENIGAGNDKRMVPRSQCSRSFAASGVERNVAAVQFYENLITDRLDGFDYQILGSRYLQTGAWQFRVFIFRGKDGNTYNEEITITGKDGEIKIKSSNNFMGL